MYKNANWWTLTPDSFKIAYIRYQDRVNYTISKFAVLANYGARPALYLNSNIDLSGSGSQSDPYTIN